MRITDSRRKVMGNDALGPGRASFNYLGRLTGQQHTINGIHEPRNLPLKSDYNRNANGQIYFRKAIDG